MLFLFQYFCFFALVFLFIYCLLFISLLLAYVMVNKDYHYFCLSAATRETVITGWLSNSDMRVDSATERRRWRSERVSACSRSETGLSSRRTLDTVLLAGT